MKTYYIPELKANIQAKDDAEFQIKKEKLLNRNTRYSMGGPSRIPPAKIKSYKD